MYTQIEANKRKTVLLISLFIAIILGLGYLFAVPLEYGFGVMYFAVFISIGMTTFSYFNGDKVALRSSGAREIAKEDNPYVYRMVENLCIASGMSMPRVHIIDSPAMNAFATGRDPAHASIALTTGIIDGLENEELEGVIAHELSHIRNYDIRVMTIVVVLVGSIALISDMFLRSHIYGTNRSRRSDNNQSGSILMIVGIILLILSPVIAELIKLAVSRRREYLADASGALLTRYPEGLARALEKISGSQIPLATASKATAHLFFANPLKTKSFTKYFSTHPPAEDRVRVLREM
jgi:heat shock protein HtpX